MDVCCGIVALGPKKYVEVFTVDDLYDLWRVEGENWKYIGATDDPGKEIVCLHR